MTTILGGPPVGAPGPGARTARLRSQARPSAHRGTRPAPAHGVPAPPVRPLGTCSCARPPGTRCSRPPTGRTCSSRRSRPGAPCLHRAPPAGGAAPGRPPAPVAVTGARLSSRLFTPAPVRPRARLSPPAPVRAHEAVTRRPFAPARPFREPARYRRTRRYGGPPGRCGRGGPDVRPAVAGTGQKPLVRFAARRDAAEPGARRNIRASSPPRFTPIAMASASAAARASDAKPASIRFCAMFSTP